MFESDEVLALRAFEFVAVWIDVEGSVCGFLVRLGRSMEEGY